MRLVGLAPETYLIIYAAIVTPILLSFFFIRRSNQPVKLHLESGGGMGDAFSGAFSKALRGDSAAALKERPLNVFFNWNGHSWDAYEVLGLPAGASMDAVTAAFERLQKEGDQSSMPFFKAAFEALQKRG